MLGNSVGCHVLLDDSPHRLADLYGSAMKRLVRGSIITLVMVLGLLPATVATAQEDAVPGEISEPEAAVLQSLEGLLDIGAGSASPFGEVESPFGPDFTGDVGAFLVVGESRLAINTALGDARPFASDEYAGWAHAILPDSNDFFVNSPYLVINTAEVTVPVSSCGPTEYRELALFITRAGQPTIGENPNVPNDPGTGATEAISLICTGGLVSTFFGLPIEGVPQQYATPYPIIEFDLGERHFVSFMTLDPFATAEVVGSFSTDINDQQQFGFLRGGTAGYDDPIDLVFDTALTARFVALAEDRPASDPGGDESDDTTEPEESAGPASGEPADTDEAQADEGEEAVADPPVSEGGDQIGAEQAAGDDQQGAGGSDSTEGEGGSSLFFIVLGAIFGVGAVLLAIVFYRKRPESPAIKLTGDAGAMLSDAEEVRTRGEREGLPNVRGWQQIPFSAGRDFRVDKPSLNTERENVVGDDRRSDVSFDGYPWQWHDARERDLDRTQYFAFWINGEGELRIGSPTDPYQFDSLRDESEYPVDVSPEEYEQREPRVDPTVEAEGTPMDLGDAYEGKGSKGIPPA